MLSRRDTRRVIIRAVLIGTVALFAMIVVGLLIASVLLAFLTITSPPIATLLTAVCLAALASLLSLFLISDRRRHGGLLRDANALLPGLLGIVRRRPLGALGTALALGVVTELLQHDGSSPKGRRKSS